MYNIYVFIYEINLENNTMQNKLFICTQVHIATKKGTKKNKDTGGGERR